MDIKEIKVAQSANLEEVDIKVKSLIDSKKTEVFNYDDCVKIGKELKLGQYNVYESFKRLWAIGKAGKIVINRKHYFGCVDTVNTLSSISGVPVAKYTEKPPKTALPVTPKTAPVTKK